MRLPGPRKAKAEPLAKRRSSCLWEKALAFQDERDAVGRSHGRQNRWAQVELAEGVTRSSWPQLGPVLGQGQESLGPVNAVKEKVGAGGKRTGFRMGASCIRLS